MERVRLKDIIKNIETGSREKGGSLSDGIPSLGAQHLNSDGTLNLNDMKYVSENFYEKMKSGKIRKGDILIVKDGATTGKVSFVNNEYPFEKSSINEHVFRIITKENYNSKYVFWYLFSNKGKNEILKDFRGATVGGITTKFSENVYIPKLNIDIQNKIVEILDKIQFLIDKRKEQIVFFDTLVKSRYLREIIPTRLGVLSIWSLN